MTGSIRLGVCSLGLAAFLAGCSMGQSDLQQWTAQERKNAPTRIKPLSEPKPFTPQAYLYTDANTIDPFNVQRLIAVFGKGGPPVTHRKEPLEAFPLDAISMVGSLERRGVRVALVKVDKLLYQVHVGNYMGQNYGKVTNITDHDVTMTELVQDGTGSWVDRTATLELQEQTK